ncbi:MAG: aspartate kinase [Candidatus Omnitrophica bacterium]|nr:MAG: Aspartokinase 2 [Candidatus Hinthialibacteria bacterium OLB16]MBE7488900.1 aspartate kinase [bacterium]MCE7907589.1 aspartate kinase [Candidatus Omnitrophica bacterium COP1]MCL4733640.1 aspartate kinase [Candidatus Omnitrophota bacterium]MBV6482434.1 Aspartate kinase Ask_LysC [bacterium]
MPILVHKYGGTSMGNIERILSNARRIAADIQKGYQVAVVVSAMSGETNRLLALADEIDPHSSGRERDMLASAGEQVSIALMAMALHKVGVEAVSFTALQAGIHSDPFHTRAKITSIDTSRLREVLDRGGVPVVAGFQGVTDNMEITTLGRGASDTSAAALAAALGAERCDIYTDVDGVYAADPRIVRGAKKIERISFDEMLEMAGAGSKVLQTRSVVFAKKYRVPLQVLTSFEDKPGTMISEEVKEMEDILVTGICSDKTEARITLWGIPDQPGIAAQIFEGLSNQGISVDMIIQSKGQDGLANMSFTVTKPDLSDAVRVTEKLIDTLKARQMGVDEKIAKVTIVGVGMKAHGGVAARMFRCLADKGINIYMISTSEIRISVVIDEDYTELAVRSLAKEFDLVDESVEEKGA